jgi:aspartate carbamoyltransferase catalytic subunit
VADFPRSVILNQVENGIAVRMAVLDLLLAGEPAPSTGKAAAG